MECKNLGIGLIVLSVTLFLGVTISETLQLKEIPDIEAADLTSLESLKDCEPKDKSLKYQTLPYRQKERIYIEIDESASPKIKPVPAIPKNRKQDSDDSKKETTEDSKKSAPELYIPLPEDDLPDNQTLIYKEICHEKKNGRKNGAKINY